MAVERALAAPPPVAERPAEAALELDGVGRRFGERQALQGITLALERGQALAVFGPNGAGKTTLLRLLATLLAPSGGRAVVLAQALPERAERVRGRVGFLSHEPLLYRELSGRENLAFQARLHGLEDGPARIEELLLAVGLERRADEPVRDLSRGLVQRLAVCRCVLHRPELLLLDEPYSHLDPEAEQLVEPLIGPAAGLTRVIASHDLERGLAGAQRVLGLRAGRQVLTGSAPAVTVSDLRALYDGAPA